MSDADFLRECCIEAYDVEASRRRAKEEFFIRRLGEIEHNMRLQRERDCARRSE